MANDFNAELNIGIKGSQSIDASVRSVEELDKALLKAADSADKLESSIKSSSDSTVVSEQRSQQETEKTTNARRKAITEEERNAKVLDKAWKQQYDSLSNTRYALYDVAALYGSVSVAAIAVTAATSGVAASYEKSFADVARTSMATGEALQSIRDDLIDLSQTMPVAFGDLTAVATLGAQLGIANSDLASFTETVAMFAATTDVTVEQTAKSIGRLTQLTKTSGAEISNLASAIYETGVNAVATEGEILSVAEQIATAGDLAGLTNYQIVALASSLASLGVAPESARGSMMRIFNTLENGATNGGEALQKIASISGMTTQQIQQDWGKDSQAVFSAFVAGLGNMQDAGQNTNNVLKELGIGAVRDIRALQLLANNTEVYNAALQDTTRAYAENKSLQEGYSIGTDTLIDQIERLKNNLKSLVGQGSGFNSFLKSAISVLNDMLKVVSDLVNNPLGRFFMGSIGAIAIAVGAWASFHVAVNLARGGLAAFITAQMGLVKAGAPLTLSLRGMAKEFYAISAGGEAALNRLALTGSAMDTTATRGQKAAGALKAVGTGLATVGKGVAGIAALSAAMWVLEKAVSAVSEARKSDAQKAEEYFGGLSGLVEAMRKDTEAGDDSLRSMTVSVSEQSSELSGWAKKLQDSTGAQVELNDATANTTTTAKEATVALGELSRAQLAQMIVDKTIDFWREYEGVLREVGVTAGEFTQAVLDGRGAEYLATQMEAAYARGSDAADRMNNLTLSYAEQVDAAADFKAVQEQVKGLQQLQDVYGFTETAISSAAQEAAISGEIFEAAGVKINDAGYDIEDASTGVETLKKSLDDLMSAMSTDMRLADSLDDLGAALYENGTSFDILTENGRANMQALQSAVTAMAESAGEDSSMFVGYVSSMLTGLQDQGVVVGSEFDWLFQMLNQLVGSQYGINFNTQAAREDIHKFINDLIVAQRQAVLMSNQALLSLSPDANAGARAGIEAKLREQETKLESLYKLQDNLANSAQQTVKPANQIASGYSGAARGAGKAAKSSDKVKKNAKETSRELRTTSDYAKDLSGIFDEIFKVSFDFRNSLTDVRDTFDEIMKDIVGSASDNQLKLFQFDRKAEKDGIASMFIDLKQAAIDAQKEVRDSVLAVQDARAKLQGLSAEGSTLDYQLQVAKALGTAERVAEIEAKIAQNKADQAEAQADLADARERQKKAIEATSTTTVGDSEQAIKNRAKLRDLAKEYMSYADTLREAGVSEAEIQKYLEQSQKDMLAQAKALGFTTNQITPYLQGIASMSSNIQKNSTSVKGNEKALDDLYQAHIDAVSAFAATGASQKDIAKFAEESRKKFFDQAKQLGFNTADLGKYDLAWQGVKKTIATVPSKVDIRTNVQNPSAAALTKFMADWNNKQIRLNATVNDASAKDWRNKNANGKGVTAGLTLGIKTKNDDAGSKRAARKRDALVKYWDYTQRAMAALDKGDRGQFTAWNNKAVSQKKFHDSLPAYRKGGHTGRGYKEDISGNVHFGEYVFPYEAVNQATGLPKPEALVSMLGASLGALPFMSGGQQIKSVPTPISSNPIINVAGNELSLVELLPNQIRQLAQEIAQAIPTNPMLSDIVMAVNSVNSTRTGKGQG